MSGPIHNEWNRFLNGGTSHYNFYYRSKIVDPVTPLSSLSPAPIINAPITKKGNRDVIPAQKGGKRKTMNRVKKRSHKRRSHKKNRQSHRK